MTLNSIEVNLIRDILTRYPSEAISQFSRKDLEGMAQKAGILSILDQRRFPDKCNQLGIGAGAK